MRFHCIRVRLVAIAIMALLTGLRDGVASQADADSGFEEHTIQFHNQSVKLAGSLLLPKSAGPHSAVVFVHGAGRHTRESLREVAEHFASNGIAALIYDKRGTGESGGAYESRLPYQNLVDDALSAVASLKQRHDISSPQIGIWGLSQGAYISAAAASRSKDIRFIIAAGASVPNGQMCYYRDNLFRHYGLSAKLRDIAEKNYLIENDLHEILQNGPSLSLFAPRDYPPPDQYLHPAWRLVKQPVLAMWGEFDQNVPVGESIAGIKNSLAHANNDKWTFIILSGANHDLGVCDDGAFRSKWHGYAPGALETMTQWTQKLLADPSHMGRSVQEGSVPATGVFARLERYERMRWYGNALVQSFLFVLFIASFLFNTLIGLLCFLRRLLHSDSSRANPASDSITVFRRALCSFNFLILCAFTVLVLSVIDQMRPTCPTVLLYLPILGAASAGATIAFLVVSARNCCVRERTGGRRLSAAFDLLVLILFVPYLTYWNLIGYHL